MNQGPQDLTSKYTIFPIQNPEHLQKLIHYLKQFKGNPKTSYCRFYLRGLCIMKSQYCRFAHDFSELNFQNNSYEEVSAMNISYSDKSIRKKMFIEKQDFYQRPLFFLRDLDYFWLYQYQFTQRYKKSGIQGVSVKQINKQEAIRNRIRQILHRQQWDKMMDYLDNKYPNVDYPINFLSLWFGMLGFQKSQTFCKFGDFIRYIVYVRGYFEANIIVPPMTTRSVYFIRPGTYLHEHIQIIKLDCDKFRKQMKKLKEERNKKLPEDHEKRFVCRYYMSGNCQKTREQCFYVHNIEDLRYDKDVEFDKAYRQPPKIMQQRLNYVSLHRYYMSNKGQDEPQIDLQEINSKFGLKDKIRKQVHLELYHDFLVKLEEIKGSNALNLYEVKQQYTKFGFNHTDENKFGQLNSSLWQIGYHQEDIVNLKGQKKTYVYKIPPLEQINQLYFKKISKILKQQINLLQTKQDQQAPQILQSSIRRLIYSNTDKELLEIPLHVYLRKRRSTLKEVLEQCFPQYVPYIFFQSSQQNFKKLIDLLKKYFKKHKKYIYKMEQIDNFIKGLAKQQINLNNFVNLKGLIQLGLMQLGKQIYFWPMSNASIIIDRSHISKDKIPQDFIQKSKPYDYQEKWSILQKEWIIVVDDSQKIEFCKKIMSSCNIFGVDLEGRLSQNGYIDLLQISCRINQKKYIFVIDMHLLKKQLFELYKQMKNFLKEIFQSEDTLKILHACQQDSIALDYCLGIKVKNVFDTSGVDIYLQQKKVYEQMRKHNQTFQHTLKKIHASKTPGLNHILQKWGAPKGINELKEQMKKVFTDYPRSFFTKRPINQQFLTYSARDVQDLIEVWQNMHKFDPQGVWKIISQIYTATQ